MKNHEFTSEIEETMQDLIEEAPPNFSRKGFDPEKYLERVYKQACNELDIEPKTKRSSGRKSSSRRESGDDEFPEISEREAPKGVTLDDAIDAALKGIRFKKRT